MKQSVKALIFMKGGAFGTLGDMTSHTSLSIQIPFQLGSGPNPQPGHSVITGLEKRCLTSGYLDTANSRNSTETFIPSNELTSIYTQKTKVFSIGGYGAMSSLRKAKETHGWVP